MADYVMMEQHQQHANFASDSSTKYDEGLPIPPLDPFFFPEICRDVSSLPDSYLPDVRHVGGGGDDDDFALDFTLDDLFDDDFFGDSFLVDETNDACMPDSVDRICAGEGRIGIEHSHVSSQSSVDRKSDVRVLDELDCSRSVRVTSSDDDDNPKHTGPNTGSRDATFARAKIRATVLHSINNPHLKFHQFPNGPPVESQPGSTQLTDKVFHVVSSENCYSGDGSSNSARVSNSPRGGCADAVGVCVVAEPASSRGSGNCGAVSAARHGTSTDSGNCELLDVSSNSIADDHKAVKLEDKAKPLKSKRKKENHDGSNESHRSSKFRKSDTAMDSGSNVGDGDGDDDEKRKARLIRNRESAQLSRQRRKHYVEELEGKLKVMHSTVQDLNNKISYFMAENATLRQQLSGGGNGICPTPQPGMYPYPHMAPMGAYPWMPAPYMVKPHGSQVPLVPIPRLKPQTPVSAPKCKKLDENKRRDGKSKVKKVASFSFMGLLLFIFLFGILVPMIDVNYEDDVPGVSSDVGHKLHADHLDRLLKLKAHSNESDYSVRSGVSGDKGDFSSRKQRDRRLSENFSEPLVASLYVPRNDKLVKIDGNLIIQSVLASEKAKESRTIPKADKTEDPGCENARNLPMPYVGKRQGSSYIYRNPTGQRALTSSSADDLNGHVKSTDGNINQWFREGLAGPMLSSGMCTEVFHFDVSPGAIIPASPVANKSADHRKNNTTGHRVKNRRFLGRLPINFNESALNITNERVGRNNSSQSNSFEGNNNKSISSTIVSVLVDPREVGDGDTNGMMGPKSLSRIFVVVLLDSVKYVTYSCMLPLKSGTGPHLVTT